MRTLSAAVLLTLASSLSHAGAFTGDVDISSSKGATTFAPETTRSIQAVSKADYFFNASDFRSSIKGLAQKGITDLAKVHTGSGWGGGPDCGGGGIPVPEPSSAFLLLPGIAYLVMRRRKQ